MSADRSHESQGALPVEPSGSRAAPPQLRVWPVVVLLAAFWAALYVIGMANLSTSARFQARLIAYGAFSLLFLAWWFSRRALTWRDRLVAPVVVMENFGARKSIRRAWEIVRTRFWWVFGFTIVLFIFSWVVVGGPQVLVAFLLNLAFPIDPASVSAGGR